MKKITLAFAVATALMSFACKKKAGSSAGAATAKMTEFKDEMCKCKDAKCAQEVSDKMTKWGQEQAKNQKEPVKANEADTKKLATIGEDMGKCMQTAMTGGATGSAEAGSAAVGSAEGTGSAAPVAGGLPKECADYKAAVDKLAACNKLPAKAKEALTKAFEDASAGWAKLPEGARGNLPTTCKSGIEAVESAAKGPCGW